MSKIASKGRRKIVREAHRYSWRRVAYYGRIVPVAAAAPAAAPADRPPIAPAAEALGTAAGDLGMVACCLGVRLEHCMHGGGDDLLMKVQRALRLGDGAMTATPRRRAEGARGQRPDAPKGVLERVLYRLVEQRQQRDR